MVAETLRPDGQLSCAGLATCDFLEHDDDPDVSSVTINATGNNVSTEYGIDFPAPSGNPTIGAGLQEFKAGVVEFDSGQSGTPNARIELWEGGALVRAGSNTPISTYAVLSFTWDAAELATADGTLVQCKIIGTKTGGSPSARNTTRIGHIEWNAEFVTTTVVTGAGSSAGAAIVTGAGVSIAAGDGSSAGVANVTGDGISIFAGDGISAGAATVAGDGISIAAGEGSAAGAAIVDGVAVGGVATGSGSSAGVAAVTGGGVSIFAGSGSSAGVASVAGTSSADAVEETENFYFRAQSHDSLVAANDALPANFKLITPNAGELPGVNLDPIEFLELAPGDPPTYSSDVHYNLRVTGAWSGWAGRLIDEGDADYNDERLTKSAFKQWFKNNCAERLDPAAEHPRSGRSDMRCFRWTNATERLDIFIDEPAFRRRVWL